MWSSDKFCIQFGPRSGLAKCQASNPKILFGKLILKKKSAADQKMNYYPACKDSLSNGLFDFMQGPMRQICSIREYVS